MATTKIVSKTVSKIVNETATGTGLAKTYQKKTDRQHVLDAPDTYTGSMEMTDYDTFVFNEAAAAAGGEGGGGGGADEIDIEKKIINKHITIIPGLYKLFDEGIVNCRDH